MTGTGALLDRLRRVTPRDRRASREILAEPYRIDWALVECAALDRRLHRFTAWTLAEQPGCPAEVAHALFTGRRAPRGEPAHDAGVARRPAYGSAQPPAVMARPYYRARLDSGPLGEGDPAEVLRTTGIGKVLTIDHVWSAIESGLIDAATAVRLARPASAVACFAGQESMFHAGVQSPGSGREAFHDAAVDQVARGSALAPPVPGAWRRMTVLIGSFGGSLFELFEAAAGQGSAAGWGVFEK